MLPLSISVTDDGLGEKIAALRGRVSPQRLATAAAESVKADVQRHVAGLDRTNQLGGESSHFYQRAAQATDYALTGPGIAVVSVNLLGFRQRYYGGTIKPVEAKMLAIPISPAAYNVRPGQMPDLHLVFWKSGGALCMGLARNRQTAVEFLHDLKTGRLRANKIRERAGGELMYVLKKSVEQEGDPSILPSLTLLTVNARAAMADAINAAQN